MIKVFIFTRDNCAPCKSYKADLELHLEQIHDLQKLNEIEVLGVDTTMAHENDKILDLMTKYNVKAAPLTVIEVNGRVYYSGNNCKTYADLLKHIDDAIDYTQRS